MSRLTEQISGSLFVNTPVSGTVARAPQDPTAPDTQAGAPALLSQETSSVTVRAASGSSLCNTCLLLPVTDVHALLAERCGFPSLPSHTDQAA